MCVSHISSLSLTHIPLLNGFDQSVLFIVSVSLLLTFCGILLFYAFFFILSLSRGFPHGGGWVSTCSNSTRSKVCFTQDCVDVC